MHIFIYIETGNKLVVTDEKPDGGRVFTEFINVDNIEMHINKVEKGKEGGD